MLSCREQGLINAPVAEVWDLLGDPNRHPEWWPRVLVSECQEVEQGCNYRAVVSNPFGRSEEHDLTIESLENCHEILIRCQEVGVWHRFLLTEAQGGTFVDAEFGLEPRKLGDKIFERVGGRFFMRRWLTASIEGLREAADPARTAA